MFKVEKAKGRGYEKIILSNTKTGESVTIIPDFGGNVQELKLVKEGEVHDIIVGNKTAKGMRENDHARSAKLSPWPNRVKDGKYNWKDNNYELEINHKAEGGHAIHGLLYDKNMNIAKMRGGRFSAQLILEYTSDGLPGYPWKFSVLVIYKLEKRGLQILSSIKNQDTEAIPVGDGWHPYFSLGGKVDDILLELPAVEKINVDKRMIPTGKLSKFTKFEEPTKIGKTNLDAGFVVRKPGKYAETKLHGKDITIVLWQNLPAYRYLQIYIPKDRKSIAVEPMSCVTDAFNNKRGLIALQPRQSFRGRYGVRLE